MGFRDLYGFAEIGCFDKVERDYGPFNCDRSIPQPHALLAEYPRIEATSILNLFKAHSRTSSVRCFCSSSVSFLLPWRNIKTNDLAMILFPQRRYGFDDERINADPGWNLVNICRMNRISFTLSCQP